MSRENLRWASRKLFGNRYRAELMLALARSGTDGVCMGDLAAQHGVQSSVYREPMKVLMELGVVEALEPIPGERRRWHRIVDGDSFWPLLRPVLDYLADDAAIRRN